MNFYIFKSAFQPFWRFLQSIGLNWNLICCYYCMCLDIKREAYFHGLNDLVLKKNATICFYWLLWILFSVVYTSNLTPQIAIIHHKPFVLGRSQWSPLEACGSARKLPGVNTKQAEKDQAWSAYPRSIN